MGNVLRQELRSSLKGTALWALALSAMTYVFMIVFPSIAREHAKWNSLIHQLPKGILAGFGMDQLSISTIFGYYGTQVYSVLVLCVAIYAALLFSGLLAREESDGTIEFLIGRPVSRTDIFLGKTLAALILAALCNAILFLAAWASFAQFHTRPFALGTLAWFAAGLMLMTLVFGALGLLLSAFVPRPRTLTSLTIGLAFVTYFLGIASAISHKLSILRFASPYSFVAQTTIVQDRALPSGNWIGLLAICVVLGVVACGYYRTKDLSA